MLTEPCHISVERLKVLRAAWIFSDGPVREDWFDLKGSREVLLGRLREGLTQVLIQGVHLHPDLTEAVLAEDFHFRACMLHFELDWESAKMAAAHKRETGSLPQIAKAMKCGIPSAGAWLLKEPCYKILLERLKVLKAGWISLAGPWLHTEPCAISAERLKVLRAAWIFSYGPVREDWFHLKGSREEKLGRLREGLAQACLQEVSLPPDLPEAVLAEEFDFSACMDRFGLDWEMAKMAASHQRTTGAGAGSCSRLSPRSRSRSCGRLRSSFHRCCTVAPGGCQPPVF